MGSSAIKDTRRVLATGNDTAVIAAGYVPYVGAIADVNLGLFDITSTTGTFTNVIINAGAAATGFYLEVDNTGSQFPFVMNSLAGANSDIILQGVNNSRYILRNSTNAARWFLSNNVLNDSFAIGNLSNPASGYTIWSSTGTQAHTATVTTSGATATYQWTKPNNTNQTLSTEVNGWLYTTGTRQWATGAIATQREYLITAPTYSFVGASTITDAYTFFVSAPVAGTNATITNAWAAGFSGRVSSTIGFGVGAVPTTNARPFIASTAVNGEYSISITNTSNGAGAQAAIRLGNNSQQSVIGQGGTGSTTGNNLYAYALNFRNDDYGFAFNQAGNGPSSGALTRFRIWGTGNPTGQTASTEIPGFLVDSFTRTWASGAITTQRESYWKTITYAFASASTITDAYGAYFEAPTAGSNATITNNYAAGFNSTIRVPSIIGSDTLNHTLTFKNTTGSQTSTGTCYTFSTGDNHMLLTMAYKTITFAPSSGGSGNTSSIVYTIGSNTGQTASTEINGFSYNSYGRTWAAGAITTQREHYIRTVTYAFASASTITNAYGWYIEQPTAGANATITNRYSAGFDGSIQISGSVELLGNRFVGSTDNTFSIRSNNTPRMIFNSTGHITTAYRFEQGQGADVASANDLTLGLDGNSFEITGNTQINAITTSNWQNGSKITLLFTSNPTVKHNTAGGGGTAVMLLAGAADFAATAGDTLTLLLSEIGGTQAWREISRAVI